MYGVAQRDQAEICAAAVSIKDLGGASERGGVGVL